MLLVPPRSHIMYRSIKKIHYSIFKKNHIFILQWSMFYHSCYLILIQLYFYKSYQRIIRQHLYIIFNTFQCKHNNVLLLKYTQMKTQQHTCTPISWCQYFVAPRFALIKLQLSFVLNCKSSSRTLGATLYHTSHTRFHIIIFFLHSFWLHIRNILYGMAGEYPGHFSTCSSLYSRNALVLLELLHKDISLLWEHDTFT